MGIYIKRMEMPENCIECPLRKCTVCDAFQLVQPYTFKDDERAAFCPMTEVSEPKTGWIPVSEKPKEEKKVYLVQLDSGGITFCRWTNENPFWKGVTTPWHWYSFDIPLHCEVVAWMPLPEPYREEDEE